MKTWQSDKIPEVCQARAEMGLRGWTVLSLDQKVPICMQVDGWRVTLGGLHGQEGIQGLILHTA